MVQLACASLCAEGFEDGDFTRTMRMLPAAGYAYVELNLWHAQRLLPSFVSRLHERLGAVELRTASVYGTSLGSPSRRPDLDLGHKLWLMEVAAMLGAERVVVGGVPRGGDGSLEAAIDTLRLLAPHAEDRGMQVCLENHAGFTLETIEDYRRVCDAVPVPNVGICIDTGHFDAADVDMDALIDELGERVNHIHVKENHGRGSVDFRRFGEGATDNHRVIEKMIAKGYSGFITVEISPPKDRPNEVADLQKPLDMFTQYVTEG